MKKHCLHILFLSIISILFLPACGRKTEVDVVLNRADSLMDTRPDSALSILDSLDSSELSGERLARYALLFNKAKFKNHIPETNDSLINIAVDFYKGRGDSLEIQSLYYHGAINSVMYRNNVALVSLHSAFEKAIENNDYFFAAMSARALSAVYGNIMNTPKEYEWAETSAKCFNKALKPLHASWSELLMIRASLYNGEPQKALALCESVDSSLVENDMAFRFAFFINKAEVLSNLKRNKEALEIYELLDKSGYSFSAHDYCRIANLYVLSNNVEKATSNVNLAKQFAATSQDSLFIQYLQSKIACSGKDYKSAYDYSSQLAARVMAEDEKQFANPQTDLLTENYKLFAENEKIRAEKYHQQFILVCVCLLLSAVVLSFLIFYYRIRLRNRTLVADKIMAELQVLRSDLNRKEKKLMDSQSDNDSLSKERDSFLAKENKFREEISSLFSMHTKFLDSLCNVWYRNVESANAGLPRLDKEVLATVKRLQDIEVVEELAAIIDKYNDGWMSKFKTAFPLLSDKEYLLSMYIYIGFKTETIAVLTDKKTTQAVHIAKYKLKNKLISLATPETSHLLVKLNISK